VNNTKRVQRMVFDAIRELNGVEYQTLINSDYVDAIRKHDEAERLVHSRCVTPAMRAAWSTYRDDRSSMLAKQARRARNGNDLPRVSDGDITVPKTIDGRGARRRRASAVDRLAPQR